MKRASAAEQAEQSGEDQINGDDVIEQPRHDQNEDAGKQCNERCETEIDMHHGSPAMHINLSLAPLVALLAGIFILIMPRLLNYIVAVYLILTGLLGLFGGGGSLHLR